MPGPAAPHILRVLSCNILAGASIQRYRQYVTRSWASVLPSRAKLDNLDSLARILPDFDVIGLQETDAGSLRSGFRNQTRYLAESAGMPYWSHQPNRQMARVASSGNGLISRLPPRQVVDYPLPGPRTRRVAGPFRRGRARADRDGRASLAGAAGARTAAGPHCRSAWPITDT